MCSVQCIYYCKERTIIIDHLCGYIYIYAASVGAIFAGYGNVVYIYIADNVLLFTREPPAVCCWRNGFRPSGMDAGLA